MDPCIWILPSYLCHMTHRAMFRPAVDWCVRVNLTFNEPAIVFPVSSRVATRVFWEITRMTAWRWQSGMPEFRGCDQNRNLGTWEQTRFLFRGREMETRLQQTYGHYHCGRNVDTCDTDANRDLTRNPFLTLKPCHVIQPSGSRTSLTDPCFFCIHFVEFCFSLGFGTTEVSGDS